MALSIDLRKRVIARVEEGMRISEAARVFGVCRRVIYNWIELLKETNSLVAKTGYRKGHSHKIKDWDEFRKFAAMNQHCTLKQMVVAWTKFKGESVSKKTMARALKKIDYTSKKNSSFMLRLMQKSENNS